MSSVESASLATSDVTEKGPIDFGVKAVSLKSQDSNRLLPTGGPLRPLPSPTISRQTSGYLPPHPSVLANTAQKPVSLSRVPSGAAPSPSAMSSGPAITAKPPHTTSVAATTSSLHGSTTYLLPRGSAQVAPRAGSTITRTNMNVQPVNTVQTLVRAQSPMGAQPTAVNNVRAPSPAGGQQRNVVTARSTVSGKPGAQTRSDIVRPMLIPTSPARTLTLAGATQLHLTTDKAVKVPAGAQTVPMRPSFCPVPTFVGQNQTTTILQRADGLQAGAPATMLTAPVRLAPPLTPLLTTQRVAVSVATRLNLQQHVTVACNIAPPSRVPALANRAPTPPTGLPTPAKLGVSTVAGGTILATTGRLAYATGQVVTAAPTVPQRMPTPGNIVPVPGKPCGAAPTIVTAGTRMPIANHQITQPGGKPRFPGARPQNPPTPVPPGGLLVVSAGNHVAVRSTLVPPAGSKVIQQTVSGSIQLAPTSVANKPVLSPGPTPPTPSLPSPVTQLTPVISKNDSYKPSTASRISSQPKTYPLSPAQSAMSNAESDHHHHQQVQHAQQQTQTPTVYIPAPQKPNNPPGLIQTQTSMVDRSANTPTISTYTLPSGASYFYEAPSGYQLATDAPLLARPLSPDAQLVTRQLSTEGPLIARPYTPIITTGQTLRYNPVMLVEPPATTSSGFPVATNASSDQLPAANNTDSTTPGKLTSSPRPSILRKRDSEGNVNVKVVKNLNAALSGTPSRSRTPSPPTPPSSLHCETNQASADAGPSSNGSTTISATSSPCPDDAADPDRPQEMSPRKKPRKQLLNDANDSMDMEFISEDRGKKDKKLADECGNAGDGPGEKIYVVKRPTNCSLLRTYKHSWKTRNNHFQRYSDVKPREERRLSVTELANQRHIVQRVKGWKIYHLSAQFENLSHVENCVLKRLEATFQSLDPLSGKESVKDMSRISELIKGTMQRSKVILEQINDAKTQMEKGLDHEGHVSEIVTRCASKRNFKKRDKY